MGLYIGAHLAQDGHEVTIIDGWAENVEAIRAGGIRVVPPKCDAPFIQKENVRALHIHETHILRDGAEFDVGFVAVKIHDTRWAAALIDRFVTPRGFVVASQNCWPDEVVASVVGDNRAVGCVMSTISVGMWEAGLVERAGTETGRLRGYTVLRPAEHTPGSGVSPRTVALAKMLEVVDTAEASPDLWSERWSKLCLNAMSNTPQAMSGMAGPVSSPPACFPAQHKSLHASLACSSGRGKTRLVAYRRRFSTQSRAAASRSWLRVRRSRLARPKASSLARFKAGQPRTGLPL